MGLFNTQKDRYKSYDYKYNRPSMFGGFAFFPPVIKYLLISNIGIFICQYFVFGSFKVGGVPLSYIFMKYFALNPIGGPLPFYPWQLFTYLFMHANFWHIFLNMFALWMFGMELENIWGSKKFMGYYLMCGIGAGLANLLIAPLFTSIGPTIGASGAVYGVLIAFAMLFPDRPIYLYFLFPIKAKYFVAVYVIIEILSVGSNSGIAHVAHLGGGLIGFIYLLITKNNIYSLFRFNKQPKVTIKKPTSIYRNRFYEKYNSGNEEVSDADYYIEKKDGDEDISQEKVDEILDKISKYGYQNLSEEEKRILFEASKKIH